MLTLTAIEIPSLSRCTATRHARQASAGERADAAACRRSEREAKDDGHGLRAVRGYDDGRSVGRMGRQAKGLAVLDRDGTRDAVTDLGGRWRGATITVPATIGR